MVRQVSRSYAQRLTPGTSIVLKDYGEVKRSAEDRVVWSPVTCQLLIKKMAHDDDDDDCDVDSLIFLTD